MPDKSKQEEQFTKARQTVYRLLNFRIRSERELRDKLKSKKLPISVVEQTIEHFRGIRLVDDDQFARQWTSSRLKKPFGLNRIRMELKTKGIDDDIINAALRDAAKHYDELEVVRELVLYRKQKYKGVEPEKVRRRIYGFLVRRGFNANTIIKAIKHV